MTSPLIEICVQRNGARAWAEVSIDSNKRLATSKKLIMMELGVTDPIDEVTLWKVDGVGELVKLEDWRPVKDQISDGDRVVVKVEPISREIFAPGA